ncbi:class I SAM-dependent methyltransferase [Methylobacillus flagellatus]|uniref:class I SAM-dependent methyltransferase n=1 Tax=Methylobacillus flagellatus TaxID=405 RepID=UPI0028538F9D|nr:class I SAM-dependent methyltransferase [Methylobacillus flagellatus]MDR5171693.1 class I SAM-dependent methyltransferase [Methylobacillus flagellatus]
MSTSSLADTLVLWQEGEQSRQALWRSENHSKPPARVQVADDSIKADHAYRLACEGTALLWRGDFQNARQLLQAMARRVDRKPAKTSVQPVEAFNLHRQAQAQRARVLGMLLVELGQDYAIALRRAPDVREACLQAYGDAGQPSVVSLRELQGVVGAYEWRKKGVEVAALGARIHPHYGVFSPVRGEYVDLVAQAPLPDNAQAFDIGTGSGVLAAVLAKRGVRQVIATDQDARALACARENMQRLGLEAQVEVLECNLFPPGKAPLVVCNPPWIPAKANAAIEYAIYDPASAMLKGFLNGASAHLAPGGEAWLILSDIAEQLGLRTREQLLAMFEEAGLKVIEKLDIRPRHGRASNQADPLYQARAAEVTSLWRLAAV